LLHDVPDVVSLLLLCSDEKMLDPSLNSNGAVLYPYVTTATPAQNGVGF